MSNCKKLPYFEGLTDETIKQGSVFDPTEGVKAYDGYDEEIEYTYSPQELDTCLVGSQVIQYRASQTSEGDMLPNICIPDGLALALPSICDDYESTTAERIIHIIKANDPTIYGIPQVTVARGTAFNVLDGVTAMDDNGNHITDITYSGTLDKEVSGDIVSIDDGDERYPVKSLEVELEPIQDLSNGQPSPDNIAPISGRSRVGIYDNVKRYGVVWNGVDNVCTARLFDASGITLDTTNFCDHGVRNPNYNNPFDDIYPWSEMKQCNVDLTKYRSGNYTLKECITAWYGDPNFVTEGTDTVFVGRYRPEFWHTRYADDDGNIYWVVAESEINGYTHAKEAIDGIGFAVDDGNGGVTCGDGQPMTDIAVNQIQARAIASRMELQNIYSLDAQIVLYLVEYGNLNIQIALGDGCSNLYRQNANDIISAVSGNTITIPTGGQAMFVKGATIDVGASSGAVVLADRREVQDCIVSGSDLVVTLDRPLDASAIGKYVSIHGSTNADLISDHSGYIGTNSKANVNYRGAILYANRYSYILGIYRQTGTNHIWVCDEDECINYTALDTNVHHDTRRVLPALSSSSWLTVGKLNFMQGVSAFAPVREAGGNSVAPVGDQQYVPTPNSSNTILLFGGRSVYGWVCGVFCGGWGTSSGSSFWDASACPLLK